MLTPKEKLPNMHCHIDVVSIAYSCEKGINMLAASAFINIWNRNFCRQVPICGYTCARFRVPVIEWLETCYGDSKGLGNLKSVSNDLYTKWCLLQNWMMTWKMQAWERFCITPLKASGTVFGSLSFRNINWCRHTGTKVPPLVASAQQPFTYHQRPSDSM